METRKVKVIVETSVEIELIVASNVDFDEIPMIFHQDIEDEVDEKVRTNSLNPWEITQWNWINEDGNEVDDEGNLVE